MNEEHVGFRKLSLVDNGEGPTSQQCEMDN